MEFKLNGSAEEALRQIKDKHYALPFATDGRKLFQIGVNFSAETRNIEKWIVEAWVCLLFWWYIALITGTQFSPAILGSIPR